MSLYHACGAESLSQGEKPRSVSTNLSRCEGTRHDRRHTAPVLRLPARRAGGSRLRWRDDQALDGRAVSRDNLHLTLAFLGAQPKEHLDALLQMAATVHAEAFSLTLDRLTTIGKGFICLQPASTSRTAAAGRSAERTAAALASCSTAAIPAAPDAEPPGPEPSAATGAGLHLARRSLRALPFSQYGGRRALRRAGQLAASAITALQGRHGAVSQRGTSIRKRNNGPCCSTARQL